MLLSNFRNYTIVLKNYLLFITFKNSKLQQLADFPSGFIAVKETSEVYGRSASVIVNPQGDLLINDHTLNMLWKVNYKTQ